MRESFTIVFPCDGKIGRRSEQQAQQIDFEAGSGQFVSEQEIETQLGHKRDRGIQDVCPVQYSWSMAVFVYLWEARGVVRESVEGDRLAARMSAVERGSFQRRS